MTTRNISVRFAKKNSDFKVISARTPRNAMEESSQTNVFIVELFSDEPCKVAHTKKTSIMTNVQEKQDAVGGLINSDGEELEWDPGSSSKWK